MKYKRVHVPFVTSYDNHFTMVGYVKVLALLSCSPVHPSQCDYRTILVLPPTSTKAFDDGIIRRDKKSWVRHGEWQCPSLVFVTRRRLVLASAASLPPSPPPPGHFLSCLIKEESGIQFEAGGVPYPQSIHRVISRIS